VKIGFITTMDKCATRVNMSWEKFLMNQFLTDYREAWEKGTKFHYSWLLILIALVSWREQKET
jgi:hypothetical protein